MAPIRCCFDQTAVWHSDAARGPSTPSFKHLVGAARHGQRDSDPERFGGPEVEEQFNFGGLLNGQIGRLVALENSPSISADQTVVFRFTTAITHQTTSSGELTKFVDRGQRVPNRQHSELFAVRAQGRTEDELHQYTGGEKLRQKAAKSPTHGVSRVNRTSQSKSR